MIAHFFDEFHLILKLIQFEHRILVKLNIIYF
jgi:hypothetical protein